MNIGSLLSGAGLGVAIVFTSRGQPIPVLKLPAIRSLTKAVRESPSVMAAGVGR